MKGKKILSLALALSCCLGAVACGEKEVVPPEPPLSVYEQYAEKPVVYEKKKAEHEDSELSLWFDHSFAKTTQDVTESSGRDTYKMYMGKNEREDCQFFVSSKTDKTFSVEVSDFVSADNASSVPVLLFYQYYFTMPFGGEDNQSVPDALPPVQENATFTVANSSAGFLLQAETTAQTPAGEYTATLNIYNENNEQVKTATVFLYVWNFILSDETACRTAMWIEKARTGGHDYQTLYDFLLENRVNAYELPYALDDPRVDEYLDNPRVNSFNILGFKYNKESGKSEWQIRAAMKAGYDKLSQKSDWFKKGYFYMVDEPNNVSALGQIKEYGEWLEEEFPGYRHLSPFFANKWYDNAKTQDWIEYLRPYINIWVPKTIAYTTLAEYGSIPGAQCLYQPGQEGNMDRKFGSYPARIQKMVEQDGDEAWWYVTSQPTDPYITLNTTEPGVAHRMLFWQQKMNDVTGFLYWSTNYWEGDGWTNREGEWSPGVKTYGNGLLMYPGGKVGSERPVSSIRLEAVRDGIEDYQMFTMLEGFVGREKMKELIHRSTTHAAVWNKDGDKFAGERVILGNYLEALSGKA